MAGGRIGSIGRIPRERNPCLPQRAKEPGGTLPLAAVPRKGTRALPREVWINPPTDGLEPRMLQLSCDTNFVPQLSQTG